MESPAKKLDFGAANKENVPATETSEQIDTSKPTVQEAKKEEVKAVAPTIKPSEADEPLLQENPQRFVLFPIKYHEVSNFFFLSFPRVSNA